MFIEHQSHFWISTALPQKYSLTKDEGIQPGGLIESSRWSQTTGTYIKNR